MKLSAPLKILLVGDYPDDPRLGSAKVVHKLREEFRALGHACDAFFSDALGVTPAGRQVRQLVSPLLAWRAVSRAVALHEYDVLDIASAEALWLGASRSIGRLRDVAIVCRSHGLEHLNYHRMIEDAREGLASKPWSRRVWYPLSRLSQVAAAARLADHLIVLNEGDRSFALKRGWLPPERIAVVPHGVSRRFLEAQAPTGGRGRGVLFCGSWTPTKGTSYLVEAWRLLAERDQRIPLTVLGPGVEPSVVREAFPAGVRELVTVVPRTSEARVMEAYRQHDVLVFPSTYEGFGLVVIEAMSQALPVIATPVGCATSVVQDGATGLLVPRRDAAALAGAVQRLMSDPFERLRLGAAAARSVAHLSWRHTAEETLRVYRSALERTR